MRTLTILISLAATGALSSAGGKNDDLLKKHLAHYQGRWQLTGGYDVNGRQVPKETADKVRLTVEGMSFTMVDETNNMTTKGTFRLDPSKKPAAIDVELKLENSKDELRGIYEIIDKDTRRSCFAVGGPRPERFVKEAKFITMEWKRIAEKPKGR